MNDWKIRAQCRGYDPKIFHPPEQKGGKASPKRLAAAAVAKAICVGCPVTEECLEAGVGAPGVWGGLDEPERRAIGFREHAGHWNPVAVRGDIDAALKTA